MYCLKKCVLTFTILHIAYYQPKILSSVLKPLTGNVAKAAGLTFKTL